ncbi:MAG: serine/threonine protein kinase [Ahniella sp.]|nr:serine/threonine protein kinase [Ahniella sp.]
MSGDHEPLSDLPTRVPTADAGATSINPVAQAVTSAPSTGGAEMAAADASQSANQIGRQYGPYKIVAELGSGGMGAVFLADQKEPVRRQVALKLLRAGMDSEDLLARFRSEGDLLARMSHPNISQMLDVGTTPDGRLYFAMEYVPGVPLVEFCNRRGTDLEHRLDLFLQVCEGVQHAHQKGVIHRDIKPSNLLVADYQGQLLVKVIDFGIAKSIDSAGRGDVGTTQIGVPIGTPAYMSPEQAAGDPSAVDTRTDVYALGVVLYKMLTDELPIPAEQIQRAMHGDLAKLLREAVVVAPSKVTLDLGKQPVAEWKRAMAGDYPTQARKLRGDLDWIILKSLERERDRRYGSVGEFAADIRRHINGEPVLASPPSRVYRIQKFVARNRLVVAASVAVLMSLVFGIIGTTAMTIEARAQRTRAEQALVVAESERARAVASMDFLEDMIAAPDPWKLRDQPEAARSIKVVDALREAGAKLAGSFADDPGLRSEVAVLLGRTLRRLGETDEARAKLEQAVIDARAAEFPEGSPKMLQAELELAILKTELGEYKGARADFERLFAQVGPDTGLTDDLENEARRAQVEVTYSLGDIETAVALARRNVSRSMAKHGEGSGALSGARANLADVLGRKGEWQEANALLEQVYQAELTRWGPTHPMVISVLSKQADLAAREGKYDVAERRYRQAAQAGEAVMGPEHPEALRQWAHVAMILADAGKTADAIKLFENLVPRRTAASGADNPNVLTMRTNYALALRAAGRLEEAERELEDIYERRQRVLGNTAPETAKTLGTLALVVRDRGNLERAESLLSQAVILYGKVNGVNHPETIMLESNHLSYLRDLGELDRSVSGYELLLPRARMHLPAGHWHLAAIEANYGVALGRAGRFDEAEQHIGAALEELKRQFGPDDPRSKAIGKRLDDVRIARKAAGK